VHGIAAAANGLPIWSGFVTLADRAGTSGVRVGPGGVVVGMEVGGDDGLGVAEGEVPGELVVADAVAPGAGVVLGVGASVGDGVLVGVGWVVAAGFVGDGLLGDGEVEGARTVIVVAHGSFSLHDSPRGAAAVTSSAPSGAAADTVASNVTVATAPGVPGPASAGRDQISPLSFMRKVRPSLASSPGDVAMLALSRSPDRSSTTVSPAGSA